ncbi:MAG: excinuclease ABC subunit B, partial [Staphylococcus epidermidis]|nr:excinuclease ABC subunit B [Staphylococcus epidermidis]MDU3164060.1 excinuclease ABC subunit B [Staphylococcus epidermidis]MDU4744481.1 excinuclease ABC subunit B [Staphylococcus epidermidis]
MLCENCHFNEAEVKLTVKGIDSTHEKWVCSVCAQGE